MRETLLHYKILGKLGQGGMGEVYRALDTKLGREVAIKVLPEDFARDPERRARFEREARAVAALRHPNIVTLHSTEEDEGLLFLTMELVEGLPLSHAVPRDGMELGRLLHVAKVLADAVASAHRSGVIHRDLKPDNILVDHRGQPHILDFGLAKVAARHLDDATMVDDRETTGLGQVIGTAYYMSPEQAEGKESDARSDVFALGILIYQMATGRRPFEGDSVVTTMSAIVKEQPRPILELRGELPRELERIIGRCLEKDPERRYESALGLRNDLERLERETIAESAISSSNRHAPTTEGRPRKGLAVVGVLALALVALLVWRLAPTGRDTETPAPEAARSAAQLTRTMIAVLPFENLGAAEDEFFADGVTEEITSRLAMVEGMGVISRTSALQYKGSSKSLREIGQELGVDYVLEGTVRWDRRADESRVRITPQLIQVSDDTHLWSDRYERTLDDIFEVQSDIATRVLESLDVAFLGSARARFDARPTANMEAYQLYLRSKEAERRPSYSGEPIREAQALAREAVQLDPDFAEAHAQLSSMTSRLYQFGFERSEETVASALRSAEEAIRLDPGSAASHIALGQYHYWCHRDYESALAALAKAERLNPGGLEARQTVAYIWRRQGKLAEALARLESILALNPRDQTMLLEASSLAAALGDRAKTDDLLARARAIDPEAPAPYFIAALLHLEFGDSEAASEDVAQMPPSDVPWAIWTRGMVALAREDYREAIELLAAHPLMIVDSHAEIAPLSMFAGIAHRALGEEAAARFAFETARSLQRQRMAENPDDFRVYGPLSFLESQLGDCEAAMQAAACCRELAPLERDVWGNSLAQQWMVGTYADCGDIDAALALMEELLAAPNMIQSPAWFSTFGMIPASLASDPRYEALGRQR